MMAWFIHIGFAIASILLCYYAPHGYNSDFCQVIAWCYVVQNILYFCFNGKKNFAGFELFFAIAFFFVNFAYPLFYYPERENWMFFWRPWDRGIINLSTSIAYMGYTFYMLGITRWFHMKRQEPDKVTFHVSLEQYILFFLLTVATYGLYVVTGGWAAMNEVYHGSGNIKTVGIYSYFYVIFTISIYLMAIFVYHIPKAKWWFYLLTIGVCLLMIIATGSRTVVLGVGLILIVGWNNNVRRFKVWEILSVTLIGVLGMWFVVATRYSSTINVIAVIDTMRTHRLIDIFSDLTINGMNLYTLVEYGLHHANDWFNGMLIDLATPIPGMAKYIVEWTGRPYETMCAQDMTTYIFHGSDYPWGLGCNMIGDAFRMAKFGGVAVSMFLIGWAVKASYYYSRTNIYWYLVHYLLVAYAVFYSRAPILFPPRMLCWSLLLLWAVRSVTTYNWDELFQQLKKREVAS